MKPINLTMVCESADWHLGTTIGELQKTLCLDDAEAFANFAFADGATAGPPAEKHITDAQWDRLELRNGAWIVT